MECFCRTAQSIKEHVSKYVFPYMAEHMMNQNEMLYSYVRVISTTPNPSAKVRPNKLA